MGRDCWSQKSIQPPQGPRRLCDYLCDHSISYTTEGDDILNLYIYNKTQQIQSVI